MKKLNFKTNSRHISQLGRELVTDFVTALVELIKNSYDADAYGVKIILDKPNTPQSRIILIDTGSGMTQDAFEKKWMVIGTNNKITEPFTPNGRKKSGKKGIGRFSVERLAEKVNIYSFTDSEEPFKVEINWNKFEDINIAAILQRIKILMNHSDLSAAKYISNQISYFLLTPLVDIQDKKTVESLLDFKQLNYESFYDPKILKVLHSKVIPILKKYEDIEQLVEDIDSTLEVINPLNGEYAFSLLDNIYEKYMLNPPKTGMILIMEGLRDHWKQKDVDKLQKELRLLVAPDFIEKDPFQIELVAPDFLIENIVLVNEILDLSYAKIDAKIYDSGRKTFISYKDKDGKEQKINQLADKPYKCGDIDVEIYFFLRDSSNLSNAGYNFKFAQKILDTYCGIKIYRDNFRVKPYGDIENDWLNLNQNKVKDTHGYLVGNNQVIGVVKISDITNPLLVDATNREGIIENEAYDELKKFVISCTNLISIIRRKAYLDEQQKIKDLENEKSKIDDQIQTIKRQYEDDNFVSQIVEVRNSKNINDVNSKIESLMTKYVEENERKKADIQQLQSSYDKHYYEAKKLYEDKIHFQESELNLYKNLASLGMLTGSFGHETSDIVSRIQTSIFLVKLFLDKDINKEKAVNTMEIIGKDFNRINAYSNLIVNFLRKRKREVSEELNIGKVIKDVCFLYIDIIKSFNIFLDFDCDENVFFSMKQIDLESIIINMITNAFEQVKGTEKRKIYIKAEQAISTITINFEDSGQGVPSEKKELIFMPFETSKEDGIGLGLNIVKDIVESYNGKIEVGKSDILGGAKFIVTFFKGGNE